MSRLKLIRKDKVCLFKKNGEKYENIVSSVQTNLIFVLDSTLHIEEGDLFVRVLPNGLKEACEVLDRGYQSPHPAIEAHYQVKVKRVSLDTISNNSLQASEVINTTPLQASEKKKFIESVNYLDDFYQNLVDEINFLYENNRPISLSVAIRKLFENIIIDIFRKKYGIQNLPLYYDKSKGRFNDFSILLKNLESNKADFHHISPNIDTNFIRELNEYREHGNAGAHSIDIDIKIEYYTKKKDDINHKFKLLLRVYNNI
jgi:hypothetical protein